MSVAEFIRMNKTSLRRILVLIIIILLFRWLVHLLPSNTPEVQPEKVKHDVRPTLNQHRKVR